MIFLDIPRRSILALTRLMSHSKAYRPKIHKDTPTLRVLPTELLGREEAGEELAAKKIANSILTCLGMEVEGARRIVEMAGKNWDQPGPEIFSTDCLRGPLSPNKSPQAVPGIFVVFQQRRVITYNIVSSWARNTSTIILGICQ